MMVYLVVGACAGTLAGLLGIGGGLIIVPVLAWCFGKSGFADELVMQAAVGTSLATIVVTSLSSILAHHRRGAVLWRVFAALTPGVLAGAFLGALTAHVVASESLRMLFGIFELAVAIQMGLALKPSPHRELPGRTALVGAGAGIGLVSALVGIGGGTMTVPLLTWCNVSMRNAVATSAAVGLPIAVAGACGFMIMGVGSDMPTGSVGYVYLPAFAAVALSSALFAPVGARLAHTLPTDTLKRIFAVFLAAVGVKMLTG